MNLDKLNKKSKLIFVCVFAAIFVIIGCLMLFSPLGLTDAELNGETMLDSRLKYYSGEEFFSHVQGIKPEIRPQYCIAHILDAFFVISYFGLMVCTMVLVLPQKLQKFALIIPAFPAVFDFIENISIDLLVAKFPETSAWADSLGVWTCLKWYTGAVWLLLFLVFGGIKLANYLKTKNSGNVKSDSVENDGTESKATANDDIKSSNIESDSVDADDDIGENTVS